MIKVGLTGNIGSGKSIISQIFTALGVPVYHADEAAKKFLDDPEVISETVSNFGSQILTEGKIDRKKLAGVVFSDEAQLKILNQIIHPRVRADLKKWISKHSGHAYVVQEAAILFESGFNEEFDKTILVVAPVDLAIKRVMERDGVSKEEVVKRMQNQWPQEKKIPLADFIIYNDGNRLVVPQVLEINESLIR
jgi:dephospho-CoA kinase